MTHWKWPSWQDHTPKAPTWEDHTPKAPTWAEANYAPEPTPEPPKPASVQPWRLQVPRTEHEPKPRSPKCGGVVELTPRLAIRDFIKDGLQDRNHVHIATPLHPARLHGLTISSNIAVLHLPGGFNQEVRITWGTSLRDA